LANEDKLNMPKSEDSEYLSLRTVVWQLPRDYGDEYYEEKKEEESEK
jgi:hypothetical protein